MTPSTEDQYSSVSSLARYTTSAVSGDDDRQPRSSSWDTVATRTYHASSYLAQVTLNGDIAFILGQYCSLVRPIYSRMNYHTLASEQQTTSTTLTNRVNDSLTVQCRISTGTTHKNRP